jgi:molecular chaperone HscB
MDPTTTRCRACEAVYDGAAAPLRCPACQAVLPPHPGATPFARLGLPLSLRVTDAEVESAWLQRSRQAHPDRFAARPPAERRAAAEQTAALNDARRALKTAFDRAVWLVRHAGVVEPKLPQARLVWFMEAREEAESPSGRDRVVADAVARFAAVDAELQALLATVDATAPAAPTLTKVAALLAEERTLARLAADLGGPVLLPSLDGR